jgi:hypothetical protein
VRSNLALLDAVMKQFPEFKNRDFSWLTELVKNLEDDEGDETAQRQRKARQSVSYDTLATVPDQIDRDRRVPGLDPKQVAWLVHDELLARFFVTLAWRQRNIRECTVGTNGNIFKCAVPTDRPIAKPEWAEALKQNPQQGIWQFRFTKPETKTSNDIQAILPRELVALLEEYLCHHRPLIAAEHDGESLFLHGSGTPSLTSKS